LEDGGHILTNKQFFDTLKIQPANMSVEELKQRAEAKEINLRYYPDGTVGISLDETVREKDINDLFAVFKVDATAEQVC
jgi:glycine dehydrogenase